jgi:hypothetical protein
MRLSAWRAEAPKRESVSAKVMAALEPLLATLGGEPDPECWVAWGEDPGTRYTVLMPVAAGLALCGVRVNVPQEGPRVSGKLIRWSKVQLSELSAESQTGHRLLSVQVEQLVLRGHDEEADRIAAFVNLVYAAIDGRPLPKLDRKRATGAARKATGESSRSREQGGSSSRRASAR